MVDVQVNATSLRVSFHSDSVNQAKGFLMQYQESKLIPI